MFIAAVGFLQSRFVVSHRRKMHITKNLRVQQTNENDAMAGCH